MSAGPKLCRTGAATAPMRQQARGQDGGGQAVGHPSQATASSPRPTPRAPQPARPRWPPARPSAPRGDPGVAVDHLAAVRREQGVERRDIPRASRPAVAPGQVWHPGRSEAGRHGRAPYPGPDNVTPMSRRAGGSGRGSRAASKEDEEFAASFRAWLADHLRRPPAFVDLADEVAWGREWQAAMAADRWVGVHWPSAYGGRSATPVQVALYQSEYARAQAPQPVNRVGRINLKWAPDTPGPRHRGPARTVRLPAGDPLGRRSGASSSRQASTPAATWPPPPRGATPVEGGFEVTGQQGLDVLRPVRLLGLVLWPAPRSMRPAPSRGSPR